MRTPVRQIRSRTMLLPSDNIETDQIIPARFLTTISSEGFGARLFADWSYDSEGRPRAEFALNRPEAEGARVLLAGKNFGCGSSREHAVWALRDHGFQAVISTSFADIFRGNAVKNGLVPVQVDASTHADMLATPPQDVVIDVEQATLTLADGRAVPFPLEPFARYCLVQGVDELEFLLSQERNIDAHERALEPSPWRLSR